MANWGNIFYGAEKGIDAFQQQRQRQTALSKGAQLFSSIGSEEANGFAELMQTDPDTAAIFAKEFGGLSNLYTALRENAMIGLARGANVAAGRALGPEYEEAAAYGADPVEIAKAKAEMSKAGMMSDPRLGLLYKRAGTGPFTDAEYEQLFDYGEELGLTTQQTAAALKDIPRGPTGRDREAGAPRSKEPSIFNQEATLRQDFLTRGGVDDFRKRADAYGSAEAGFDLDDSAGDLQLVYNAIKLWDPNAVREGEIALARGTAGIPGYLASLWDIVSGGKTRLPLEARLSLINSVRSSMHSLAGSYEDVENEWRDLAGSYPDVNVRRVVPDYLGKFRGGKAVRPLVGGKDFKPLFTPTPLAGATAASGLPPGARPVGRVP